MLFGAACLPAGWSALIRSSWHKPLVLLVGESHQEKSVPTPDASASSTGSENIMSTNLTKDDIAFDSFDVEDIEVLEAADGTALPEMGASSGSIGTSSSSSTCSAC